MAEKNPLISIIIPAFNEADRVGNSLEKLTTFLNTRDEEFEVIVVDDASTDNTKAIAESFKDKIENLWVLRLEESPYAGKGLAVNKGVLAAKGDIVLFTDADFSTPIEEIDKLLEKINSGFDIAIGSRAADRSTVKKKQHILRELMGKTFNILVRTLTVKGIFDTQCGFKAFRVGTTRQLFENQKIFDFGFDVEILFLAQRQGLKIAEVPVLWFNDQRSTVHPIKDSYRMFLDLLKIRMYYARPNGSSLDKLCYIVYHYRTFWRFSIVGATNTVVDIGALYLLTRIVGMSAVSANLISVEIAIIWSFIWNNLWTFSERNVSDPLWKKFLVFQFVSLGGYVVNQISFLFFFKIFNVFDLFAKVLTVPITLVFNYVLNSRWTFRDERSGKASWLAYSIFILILFLLYFFLTKTLSVPFFGR